MSAEQIIPQNVKIRMVIKGDTTIRNPSTIGSERMKTKIPAFPRSYKCPIIYERILSGTDIIKSLYVLRGIRYACARGLTISRPCKKDNFQTFSIYPRKALCTLRRFAQSGGRKRLMSGICKQQLNARHFPTCIAFSLILRCKDV